MVTAMLTDQDGNHTDIKWQWYGVGTEPADSDDEGDTISFSELEAPRKIEGATMSTYTPRAEVEADEDAGIEGYSGDEGDFLVATVSYKDAATDPADEDDQTTGDEPASILGCGGERGARGAADERRS